ncbi:hypothetical protein AABD69_09110 [Edwardsiella piscicida]|uniref:hypothetical protein n=1 Tax=Edwardsiella piscicida TaxID=1263550 RepID=UPI000D50E511|nr:hypothetical protein [Edwardsiella piscicida]UCQ36410.1 hypothetical protein DCF36_09120 [Edwardsiella piscicida]
MNKTPCEKLGYKVGDKFVVVGQAGGSRADVGDIITLKYDDGSNVPHFTKQGDNWTYCPLLEDIVKLDSDGWAKWERIDRLPKGVAIDMMAANGRIVRDCRHERLMTMPMAGAKWRPHVKPDADGWCEWKGGKIPVVRGTLVDVKYRDGVEESAVPAGHFASFWKRDASQPFWCHDYVCNDIVAYRLHKPEQQFKGMAAADVDGKLFDVKIVAGEIVSCTPSKRDQPTIDELMYAWKKAKANSDTSRNILKLAEQDEADARKALDDALRAAGWSDDAQPLNITDWHDLKVGDIVWWSGGDNFEAGEYLVDYVDPSNSCDCCPFRVIAEGRFEPWVNIKTDQWRFIRRPA